MRCSVEYSKHIVLFKMAAEDVKQGKHKPGPLKQQNKPHKHGRHRTKGQIDNTNKGIFVILHIFLHHTVQNQGFLQFGFIVS